MKGSLLTTVWSAFVAAGGIGSLYLVYRLGYKHAENDKRKIALNSRYDLIYVPICRITMDMYTESCRGVNYPKFSQRLKRSWEIFMRCKWRQAYRALFDRYGEKPITGLQFGGEFPLQKIKDIVRANIGFADKRLVNLIQCADRYRMECPYYDNDNPDLTDYEIELVDHIWESYTILNKKFLPQ